MSARKRTPRPPAPPAAPTRDEALAMSLRAQLVAARAAIDAALTTFGAIAGTPVPQSAKPVDPTVRDLIERQRARTETRFLEDPPMKRERAS